jgi:N-carbamoyl-L-amino-acid hydrolase
MYSSDLPILPVQPSRLQSDLDALEAITDPNLPYTRPAFSDLDIKGRQWLKARMENAGLEVHVDTAANLIGRRKGLSFTHPVIMMGSHIDTVRSGGRFDGIIGVLGALEVIRSLNDIGWTTQHDIEVVNFTCEEPNAFSISPLGSKLMSGAVSAEQVRESRLADGTTLSSLINYLGGDEQKLESVLRGPDDIHGYLELHIEQGPVLEREHIPLGVVTAIAAPLRATVTIFGVADHSGATMMNERYDALCAAAEIILCVERLCGNPDITDTVGTIGHIEVSPNMVNIIPGLVELRVDIRSTKQEFLDKLRSEFETAVKEVSHRRSVQHTLTWTSIEEPVPIPDKMQMFVMDSCQELGYAFAHLPSRAAHDASRIADISPVGMIFIPCKDGKSHTPEEWANIDDIARGTEVLGRALLKLDIESR